MVWQQVQQSQQQQEAQYESESGDNTDVPASQLADKDSLFVDIFGLNVHYKQAYPAKVCFLVTSCMQQTVLPCANSAHLLLLADAWCLRFGVCIVRLLPTAQQ